MKARSPDQAHRLVDIPNVGPATAGDLRALGIELPRQLVGQDPYALYARSNALRGLRQDPCVCDAFIAAVRFMEGATPRPWWHYTAERKQHLAGAGPG